MTGYQSKKTAALDEDGMYLVHHTAQQDATMQSLKDLPVDFGPQPDMHYGMDQDDWKDIVAAISKARDSRGIYLACRPADVFQDWFLAMGLFKPKEKNNG